MSFFYPFVTVYGSNPPSFQYIQLSHPSLTHNHFQPANFYSHLSQLPEQNTLLFPTSFNTQESLASPATQKPAPKKKKAANKKDEDQNFGWRLQNKDRNIMSNILKAFVNYIYDQVGMKAFMEKLYSKLDLQTDVSEFNSFFEKNFPVSRSYVSTKFLKALLRDPTIPQSLLTVLKLLMNRFFRVDFPLILLNSKKIKRRSKMQQMKKSRDLLQLLFRE